jgi:hypothetical protein
MRSRSIIARIVPAVGVAIASACSPAASPALPAGLTVEEHALREAPTLDPLTFRPVESSMDTILARRAADRASGFPDNSVLLDGHFSMRTTFGADTLTATENYSRDGASGWVTVTRDGQEVYRVETGMASPVTSLRGLWTYADHWVLETAYIAHDSIGGRLSRDGQALNASLGYEEAFDFQLLHGRPFYFFKKDGKIGFSYDGKDVPAGYDEIPHYGCCSDSEVNPRSAQNLVAFFARRDGAWYYVEMGVFN